MRFVSFFKRAFKWLFGLVFSKKFMLSMAVLLAVLVSAVCISHYFYNKHAEQHWVEVQQRWIEEVGPTDLETLFPTIPDDEDLYKDAFFVEYLSREDQVFGEVGRMNLKLRDGSKLQNLSGVDYQSWFPEGEVETEADAAKLILEILKPLEKEAKKLSKAITEKRVSSVYNPGLSVSSLQAPDWNRIELLEVQKFFIDRTHLRKLAGDEVGATEDLKTVFRILEIVGCEPNLYHFSVKSNSMMRVSALMEKGMERSLWVSDDLKAFQSAFSKLNLHHAFKNIPLGERVYGNQVRGLYDEIGKEEAESLLMGEDAKYFENENAFFDWSDKDWGDKVNWDVAVGYLMSPLVPVAAEKEGLALADEFYMDVAIPHFNMDLSIEAYRSFKSSMPEYTWYEEMVSSLGDTYVMYYGMVLRLEMQRRLFLVSLALENEYLEHGEYPENLASLAGVDLMNVFDSAEITYTRNSDDSYEIASAAMSDSDSLDWMRGSHGAEGKRLTFEIDKFEQKN